MRTSGLHMLMVRNESANKVDGIHSGPLTLPRHDDWIEDTQEEREKDEVGGCRLQKLKN